MPKSSILTFDVHSVLPAFELAAVEDEEGGGADEGEGGADEGGGGESESGVYGHASDRGRDGVRDIERDLYAGASEHLAPLGISDYEVLQRASDAEEAGRGDECKHHGGDSERRAEIERGHYQHQCGGDDSGDQCGGIFVRHLSGDAVAYDHAYAHDDHDPRHVGH